jgi:hypothetical protein
LIVFCGVNECLQPESVFIPGVAARFIALLWLNKRDEARGYAQ